MTAELSRTVFHAGSYLYQVHHRTLDDKKHNWKQLKGLVRVPHPIQFTHVYPLFPHQRSIHLTFFSKLGLFQMALHTQTATTRRSATAFPTSCPPRNASTSPSPKAPTRNPNDGETSAMWPLQGVFWSFFVLILTFFQRCSHSFHV